MQGEQGYNRGKLKTSMKQQDFGKDCGRVTNLEMQERNGVRISGGRWSKILPELPKYKGQFELDVNEPGRIINKKRNWSAPGPDRIANYWWKRARPLHGGVAASFQANAEQDDHEFPLSFAGGKKSLIPKPSSFQNDNQAPITCLNTVYKWYTACLLVEGNQYIGKYGFIQQDQRGAKENCSWDCR